MQHIITDEEVERFYCIYAAHQGSFKDARKAALTDFLNNRPESTLGKLRPIAEMSEKPPEGCFRQHYRLDEFKGIRAGVPGNTVDHWAIDILTPTPDPEAEERQRFEEAMKKAASTWDLKRDTGAVEYNCGFTQSAWEGWKRCAELAKA